ncbi:MAG: amidase [Burkholderiaceae bacterium]
MTDLGLRALRRAIQAGDISADAALRAAFDRARAAQPRLHAFAFLPDAPPAARDSNGGPLAGIAVGVKDLIDTADMPTAYGSPIYRGHRPAQDAAIVRRLRELGAAVLGKTATTEFAWRHPADTVNPWNPAHTPGGSSSGSAAAVAAGIVPLAIGSQTLGSVLRPAAYCGVVGFKPSFGALPRDGVFPFAPSLDHVGLFTRGVDDAADAFALLSGRDLDAATPAAPRIGLPDATIFGELSPEQAATLRTTADALTRAGAAIVETALPPAFADAPALALRLAAIEAAPIHAAHVARQPALLSETMRDLIEQGRAAAATHHDVLAAQQALRQTWGDWMAAQWLDAVLLPPAAGEAPQGLANTGDARFCSPVTLLGVPAIALPAGFGPNGLPLGVQLVGQCGGDAALLATAAVAQAAIGRPFALAPAEC